MELYQRPPRHELKYVTSAVRAAAIVEKLAAFIRPDEHGEAGTYEVASLYFDTRDLRFFRDREESVGYRRKIRLRSYSPSHENAPLFLEIKERYKAKGVKKRAILTSEASRLLGAEPGSFSLLDVLQYGQSDSLAIHDAQYLYHRLDLVPTAVIRYHRRAMVALSEFDLRLTVDSHLTVGLSPLNQPTPQERFILPADKVVFEVKTSHVLPLWLLRILESEEMRQVRFSKYSLGVQTLYPTRMHAASSAPAMKYS